MIFLSGPRQVGKTTTAKSHGESNKSFKYFNWDNLSDRKLILDGPDSIADKLGLFRLASEKPLCIFDKLHKYRHWRDILKGFFDTHEENTKLIVAGSASIF